MLGRGLASLIPGKEEKNPKNESRILQETRAQASGVLELPIDKIKPNPSQPRENFGHEEMEELAESIKVHGILQPLIVSDLGDGTYELIAGERRLRAATFAGLHTVPVILRRVKEHEKLELALIENIQRKNLNPIEEAKAYKRLSEEFGLTQEAIAKRVGKSRPVVANTLRLLNLPDDIQRAVSGGRIFASQARLIAGIDNLRDQRALFNKFLRSSVSLRQSEQEVRKVKTKGKLTPEEIILASKEAALRETLGTKVEIRKKGEKGSIIIEFYSGEELSALITKITDK